LGEPDHTAYIEDVDFCAKWVTRLHKDDLTMIQVNISGDLITFNCYPHLETMDE